MTRALAAALAAGVIAGGVADAATITVARGIGAWTLGRQYLRGSGLVRSQRFPDNSGPGCLIDVTSATRIDYYRTIRTAWRAGARGRLYLFDVATTRAGNRSGDGFVIAQTKLAGVRRAHPKAAFGYGKGEFALGASFLRSMRKVASERFAEYTYWFDARGVLTALETGNIGC